MPNTSADITLSHLLAGRWAQALAECERLLVRNPADAHAHHNMAMLLVLLGRDCEGWAHYPWRWQTGQACFGPGQRHFQQLASWDAPSGLSTREQALVVWHEQGLGDQIFFASYLPALLDQYHSVHVCLDSRVLALFQRGLGRQFPRLNFVPAGTPLEAAGAAVVQAPLGDVPLMLCRQGVVPRFGSPALKADPLRVQHHRKRRQAGRPLVGLSWKTTGLHADARNLPLQALLAACRELPVDWVNLQYQADPQEIEAAQRQTGQSLHNVSGLDAYHDVDELAAVMSACDLVITIGNANAHLAGALGVPAWVLLPRVPYYRWGLDREVCPWYPGARLIRQAPDAGDAAAGPWHGVLHTLEARLHHWVATTCLMTLPSGAQAIRALNHAHLLEPDNPDFLCDMGLALHNAGQYADALHACDLALAIRPDSDAVHYNRGLALKALGHPEEAMRCYERALQVHPRHPGALNNLGNLCRLRGDFGRALACHDEVLRIDPGYADAHVNRAASLIDLARFEEARAACQMALAIQPGHASALVNMGLSHFDEGDVPQCLHWLGQALAFSPQDAQAHFYRSLACLSQGDLRQGWSGYPWRWLARPVPDDARKLLAAPACLPSAGAEGELRQGILLLWGEQGLGDQILMLGMLGELARHRRVRLALAAKLLPLMQRSFGQAGVEVVDIGQAVAGCVAFDCQMPLGDLPGWLRADWDDFPQPAQPYLQADAHRVAQFRRKWHQPGRVLCGLAWHSANAEIGRNKSMDPAELLPLLEMTGVDFIDLQYGDTSQARTQLASFGVCLHKEEEVDNFADLDGLAALIGACDVVVTISNTTAHVAAAMGKPVYLMLPYGKGRLWYWHSGRSDSPWYANVRIWRQAKPGEWNPVVQAVREALDQRRRST